MARTLGSKNKPKIAMPAMAEQKPIKTSKRGRPVGSKSQKETIYTLRSTKCTCTVKTSIKSMTGYCGAHGNELKLI